MVNVRNKSALWIGLAGVFGLALGLVAGIGIGRRSQPAPVDDSKPPAWVRTFGENLGLDTVADAALQFRSHTGQWPRRMEHLRNKPTNALGWNGPYLGEPTGPELPYSFRLDGADLIVSSPGADGELGTEDDLQKRVKPQ